MAESHHNKPGRAALEHALMQANENMRVNIKLHGQLTSAGAFGAAAANEVLTYMANAAAQRASQLEAVAPEDSRSKPKQAPKAKTKSGSAARAKAPKRKAGPARRPRGRG
jgi:hypothetical protein